MTKKTDDKTTSKPKTLAVLVTRWINHLVYCGTGYLDVNTFLAEELESEGQKRRGTLSALKKAGYLAPALAGCSTQGTVTSKAYDEIVATAPTLIARLDAVPAGVRANDLGALEQAYRDAWGIPFAALDLAEQKFVVEQASHYSLFTADSNRPTNEERARPTTLRSEANGIRGSIWVNDAAYRARRAELIEDARFQRIRGENLAFGVVNLGLVPKADAEAFFKGAAESAGLFGYGRRFSADPTKWQAELAAHLKAAEEREQQAQREQRVLKAFERRLLAQIDLDEDAAEITDEERARAWMKFHVDYDACIRKAIADRDAAEPEKASAA